MARFSGVYADLRPLSLRADTAGLGAIRLDLGSGIGLLPKRSISRARLPPSQLAARDHELMAEQSRRIALSWRPPQRSRSASSSNAPHAIR
jgi:hypothetical protein